MPLPVVIAGPTGAGKSRLALRIALECGGEIVNYDSVQVYRGFDIGSAKPSEEERRVVPHHLFDIIEADDEFNASAYGKLARHTCEEIAARGRLPLLVGGTFFYLRAFLSGLPEMPGRDEAVRRRIRSIARSERGRERLYRWLARIDPVSAARIAPNDRHRVERAIEVWLASGRPISSWDRNAPEIPSLKIALRLDRELLRKAIDRRVEKMFAAGLIEETRRLLARYSRTARPFGAIGYREAAAVVCGEMALDAAVYETGRRTRAYAKRQMTWLRSEPGVHWLDASNPDELFRAAMRLIEGHR